MTVPLPGVRRFGALALLFLLCSCAGAVRVGGVTVGAAKGQGKGDEKTADSTVSPIEELGIARAALERAPNDVEARFQVGLAWQRRADSEAEGTARRGFQDSARVAFDAALAVDSTHVKSLVHSGLVLEDLNEPDEALKRYTLATHYSPDDPRPYVNLGSLLYFHFKRIYDAKVALAKALELDPSNADAHFNLGVLFADASMYREARAEWERVVTGTDSGARALAQQNLEKIRPLLASQDSAEGAPPPPAPSPAAP